MALFFGGNPFTSPVGKKIEQATDASLPTENWTLNMAICDLVNETEDGPKDAIKAIRKRLNQNATRNYTTIMYTLSVLEACVKNCHKKFLVLVCNKEFIQELVKVIGPKNDPPAAVQQRILNLIQCWANSFKQQPELNGVVQVYTELKQKGVEFPAADVDVMTAIPTSQRSFQEETCTSGPLLNENSIALNSSVTLSSYQLGKLMSELRVVEGNMTVLSEMLGELVPGQEPPSDLELMKELYTTCQAMQERLVELINQLSNDEITAELLRVNDGLNNLFLRYSRYDKNRKSVSVEKDTSEKSLIDLNDNGTPDVNFVKSQLSNLSLNTDSLSSQLHLIPSVVANNNKENEFDVFNQVKDSGKTEGTSKNEPNSGFVTSTSNQQKQINMHLEQDFDEMAAWLGEKQEESLTSSEFEKFLAERAAAAEALPPDTESNSPSTSTKRANNDSMFAL